MSTGLLTTADMPTDLMKKSYAQLITRLSPNGQSPLYGLTALLKEETAMSLEHGYYSKRMIFPTAKANGAQAAGVTNLLVVSNVNLIVGDMLTVDGTGENVLIESVPDSTHLVIRRAVGTVVAASIPDQANLYHIGNAFEQASLRPQAVNIIAERYINYTQIFRNSWSVSETLAAIPMIAGDGQVTESKQDCALLHALSIEKALFWGQKFQGTRNGQPFQTMEGIIPRVLAAAPGNITTLGATTNWTQFEAALDVTLQTMTDPKGGTIRTAFVGGTARRVIHNIARLNSSYQITTQETKWGLQIDQIRTPRGIFEIIEHPLFNAYGPTSTWAKMMVVVDLAAFAIAYLRKTREKSYNEDGQSVPVDNGVDAKGGTLTTELTCLIKNPEAFAVIYNFTAAAAG